MNKTLIGFIKKELSQLLRDRRMRSVLFIMPVIQLTLFGVAITSTVRNIRLACFYSPSDTLAREIAENCYASKYFVPVSSYNQNPYRLVQSGKADAALITPWDGLTKSFERGHGRLQLLVDASDQIKAQSTQNYIRAIINQVIAKKYPHRVPKLPFVFKTRILYNPALNTSIFMVPAVLCMILTIMTVSMTSMAFTREKEMGTFETLISAPIKTWEILLGKTIPFALVGILDIPLVMGIAIFGFHVPMRGAWWELILSSILYICTGVSVGTLLSTISHNQQQSMIGGFIFLFPAIQLSGIMYPVSNMPIFIRIFSYLDPLYYFIELLRNIMLKGGGPSFVATRLSALALLTVVAILFSFKKFHQTLN